MTFDDKWLVFWLNNQLFGVSINNAEQIIGVQPCTEVPETPDWVKGVINLRGSIMPLIDLRLKLGKPETEYTSQTCIIINNIEHSQFGFLVDGVETVTDFDEAVISAPPKVAQTQNGYLVGIAHLGNRAVLLMDIVKLFSEQESESLINMAD